MFLTFINELTDILERHGIKVKVFADDVKVLVSYSSDCTMMLTLADYIVPLTA